MDTLEPWSITGRVDSVHAATLRCSGLNGLVTLGAVCAVERAAGRGELLAEAVAFDRQDVILLPYDEPNDIAVGAKVALRSAATAVRPSPGWLGRVVDAMGTPMDGRGPLPLGPKPYEVYAAPPPATERRPLGERLDLGVTGLDLFVPCCKGQRLGIFAGSGVGKSTLLSMIAQRAEADCIVVGLIGERGREVTDFLNDVLGPETLKRAVIVCATSDRPAMARRRAAWLTLTIAEALRDTGRSVLCLVDSLTRFATALREIYLAAEEPPATRGFPPSVFSELPRLLERAGPGIAAGDMTALFTVLTEGDDTEEPVADAVRAILDGHIVLERRLAEAGKYPAINVLRSVSRTATKVYAPEDAALVAEARALYQTYEENADLVRLGAYQSGNDAQLDRALACHDGLEALVRDAGVEHGLPPMERLRVALSNPSP